MSFKVRRRSTDSSQSPRVRSPLSCFFPPSLLVLALAAVADPPPACAASSHRSSLPCSLQRRIGGTTRVRTTTRTTTTSAVAIHSADDERCRRGRRGRRRRRGRRKPSRHGGRAASARPLARYGDRERGAACRRTQGPLRGTRPLLTAKSICAPEIPTCTGRYHGTGTYAVREMERKAAEEREPQLRDRHLAARDRLCTSSRRC